MRSKVGLVHLHILKESGEHAMLCYCFGVTKVDLMIDHGIKDFVAKETKLGLCSC